MSASASTKRPISPFTRLQSSSPAPATVSSSMTPPRRLSSGSIPMGPILPPKMSSFSWIPPANLSSHFTERFVYENHSGVTKKNKEWQEKLPIVVLKVEEIMYSKANSEVEYMATETLWDRVNDAVDTIIRKDASAETGELLPPCVEAALNLGCIPVRASRSQRHNNPRTYLNPRFQETGPRACKVLTGSSIEHKAHLVLEPNRHSTSNVNNPIASSYENVSFLVMKENNSSCNLGSVYPLYYGTNFQPEFQEPHMSKDIIVGTPIFASFENPTEIGCLRAQSPSGGEDERIPNQTKQSEFWEVNTEHPAVDCDLSLRLGLFSNSVCCVGSGSTNVTEGIDPINSGGVVKIKANDPSRMRLGRYDMEGEDQNVEAFHRKRKLPIHSIVDNSQMFWPIDPSQHPICDQRKKQNS